jgi:hypothetical protein
VYVKSDESASVDSIADTGLMDERVQLSELSGDSGKDSSCGQTRTTVTASILRFKTVQESAPSSHLKVRDYNSKVRLKFRNGRVSTKDVEATGNDGFYVNRGSGGQRAHVVSESFRSDHAFMRAILVGSKQLGHVAVNLGQPEDLTCSGAGGGWFRFRTGAGVAPKHKF